MIAVICNIPTDVATFERAGRLSGVKLKVYDLKGDIKEFKEYCKNCRIVVAKLMGGKNVFPVEEFHTFLVEHGVHFCPLPTLYENVDELKKYSTVSAGDWEKIMRYLTYEGVENYKNLLLFLANRFCGLDAEYEEPKSLPWQGIYYRGRVYGREFLERLDDDRPTIGILFYRSWWAGGDLEHIDALIGELDKYANVVAVFSERNSNEFGAWGFERCVEEFFMQNGEPVIDVLVNLTMFSLTASFFGLKKTDFLTKLDVPLLQAIASTTPEVEWRESKQGLNPMDVVISAAMPEFDSAIIHFPIACRKRVGTGETGVEILKFEPITARIKKFAKLAVKYAILRRKRNSEKRIAIVLHNYPPRNDRIASAFGLDSPESVVRLLKMLKERGYKVEWVPENGNELIQRVMKDVTNDQRFLTTEIAERMKVKVELNLPEEAERKMREQWGEKPGKVFVYDGCYLLPIVRNGNVLIALQPRRGFEEEPEKVYHDPDLPPSYQYVALYRYISEVFNADAMIHVGKHGTLEWLPGKGFGLSENCFPDVCMDVPHFYIYIVNNPGEGTQAKRRGYACIIDHLTPALTTADLYDDYLLLEKMINDYYDALRYGGGEEYRKSIIEKARELKIVKDEEDVERVHEVLLELKMSMINAGLHVFGEGLRDEKLVETILSILRIKHDDKPSIIELAAKKLGYDLNLPNEECAKRYGKTKSRIMDEVLEEARRMIAEAFNGSENELSDLILDLKRKLEKNEELDELLRALEGGYIKPGMSGAITRNPNALPTGRNFYSCNPWELPTKQAYERGKTLAEKLLERYLEDGGSYPETVAMVIWSSPTMRTHGEDVAEFLYLLGVKPRYDSVGRVVGLEVIPLEELKRPRIDVVARVSGMFRDSFFNLIELMDDAVKLVSTLDEPEEMNFVKKHAEGKDPLRIFSDMPGVYGAGVNKVLDNKNWESVEDLAKAYVKWGCYAYGRGKYGIKAEEEFKRILRIVEVTVKNEDSQEWDIFEGDDFNAYHGGLIATVRALGGKPKSYVGDSSNPENIKIRGIDEEAERIYRSKVMNPKWINEMKKHGYKGAGDFSKYIDHIFQWDATSDIIDDWMYEGIAERYIFDKEMQDFFRENNPHALMNIAERLFEAIQRGMWRADEETKERLRKIYLKMEGELE
ncbi:cobaltochelatase subunit CobN [Archaeoglobus neptunius]|uniref:cobaltochelatase subunit CobN n=1 Tax=Archaeoglobus neptunius TaxID=2798580 RepID=UPI0019289AE8|nr:cobaltochelatase subunit CobN [Archaeoglobus neptunius]